MRRQSWKDDLIYLVALTALQFAVVRVADWAKGAAETNDTARQLVENHFYYFRETVIAVTAYFLFRFVRHVLDLRGLRLLEWLKSSILVVFIGIGLLVAAHLDQILAFLASTVSFDFLTQAAQAFSKGPVHETVVRFWYLRWIVDIAGLLVCLYALRLGKPGIGDQYEARKAAAAGDFGRAGDLYLRIGDVKGAKKAFRQGKLRARLAALELREGNTKGAAALFEEEGDAFAWEAARAWETAGDTQRAEEARWRALNEARTSSRWDRLAEIAEAVGDQSALGDASKRLAELKPPGLGRTGLWKRAGDAFRAAGRDVEGAEAYRAAGEFLAAAELYLKLGKPAEAAQDFERCGDMARAAEAASLAGNVQSSHEFAARDAEARGDLVGAAEAWRLGGQFERSAGLFERRGLWAKAAAVWKEAGRPDRSAPLFQKAGEPGPAAAAYEESGQAEKSALLYRELGQHQKAATLFRTAGKGLESAQELEAAGFLDDAAPMYRRVGRGLDAARCALHAGHREQAWEYLTSVPRSEAGAREFFMALAEAHLQAGEAKDAVHVLRELLGPASVTKENAAAHHALVGALASAGDAAEAADRYARLAEFDPSYARHAGPRPPLRMSGPETLQVPPGYVPPAAAPRSPMPMPGSMAAPGASPGSRPPSAGPSRPASSGPGVLPSGVFTPSPSAPPQNVNSSGTFPTIDSPELRYEILAELGRGGMGVVHKALDRKLDRHVALKILPWQLHGDETAMRYFAREAKAIAALKHPNIVALYDYGEGFGSLYLAMEFLEGPNLQTLLKADPERVRLSWRAWFVQATRGVAAAHAKGLLHRDLKPANLMLDEHGTLRILDFGLARSEADSGTTSKLIGTPAFFPPEVLRGETPSPASDVYSLGATFYTLATGRWPYIGEDILVARLEREPDDPRPYAAFLTEEEVNVLMKALARHRPERYPDAGELLAALLALEEG